MVGAAEREDGGAPQRVATGRPSRIGKRVLRFFAVISFLCAAVSFTGSSVFDIRSVTVTGSGAITASEILSRAGVRAGASVFSVNISRIQDHLREDPRLAAVSVGVVFPDRVFITVRERTAAVALHVPGGYMLLGSDGLAIIPAATAGPLPALTVDRLDPAEVEAGSVVASADARLGADLAGWLPDDLRPDVAALRVDRTGEVILYTRDGIAVRAGGGDGLRDRIARAAEVLAAVRSRAMHVEYVDLRFPGTVIVKPVRGPAAPRGTSGRAPRFGAGLAGELLQTWKETPD
ncbi:MAG TPA: FtsQ-type POTRA domain-containing protein [bacterium]|nr:FtsQ-type POTRA domain-containing protein [bacterium]